jgi:uncharacterized protein YdaU (DUF1376 family)
MGDAQKLLAEWFWTDRWMGSSAFLLPIAPRGLYREMLTQAWRRGARLPNDHEAIRRAVGCTPQEWSRWWPKIESYWRVDGDSLVNDTQVEVYTEAKSIQERASRRGQAGARARAQGRAQAATRAQSQGPPENKPPSPSPSPSPIHSLEKSQESVRTRAAVDAVQRLVDTHAELHERFRGVAYIGNPQRDYFAACELVKAFPDPALQDAIVTFGLNDTDAFMDRGSRTLGKIASQASKYAEEIKAKRLA